MRAKRWMAGLGLGAMFAAGILVTPALQAQEKSGRAISSRSMVSLPGGLGGFTPAAADPKLAAVLARSGLPSSGFRFTPSDSRSASNRAVTVAVRAHSTRGASGIDRPEVAMNPSVKLAPIAYNLGVSVGWKRFAVSGDITRIDPVSQPGRSDNADLITGNSDSRVSGRLSANIDRPLGNVVLIGDKPSYSVDMGGSYSLTRNLDVTAGLRLKSDRDRLAKTDDRRDSQAVYVGTAFRF